MERSGSVKETTVRCRVVTPMFSRSEKIVDSESNLYDFELRPQSVKGVLHFWFRAVAPRVIDIYELNVEKLPKELRAEFENEKFKGLKYLESLIFGSQSRKAPFGLMVFYQSNDTESIASLITEENYQVKKFSKAFVNSFKYSLYGLYSFKKDEKFLTSFLKPGSNFSITVFAQDELTSKVILSLLKLVSVVSGFGAKTTKGFGQFEIVEPLFERNKFLTNESLERLISEVEETLRSFIEKKDEFEALKLGRTTKDIIFPSFLPGKFELIQIELSRDSLPSLISSLYGIRIQRNGQNVRIIREWYRQLKYNMRAVGQNQSKDAVKELVNCINRGSGVADIGPAIIGLPILYQNLMTHTETKSVTITPKVQTIAEGVSTNRKTSTVRIVIYCVQNSYKAACLVLESQVTQNSELLHNSERKFQLKLTATFNDLKNAIRRVNKQYEGQRPLLR